MNSLEKAKRNRRITETAHKSTLASMLGKICP